ncbi:MAG: O-antigen ligase family protein, partial [Acidobacteria bacterium]|nr:O-antigen ligase family protein [Acidobacteriota bacterium]
MAALAALLSAVAILCTSSRMGILGLTFTTLLVASLEWRAHRSAWRTVAPALAAIFIVSGMGLAGLGQRWSREAWAAEKEGRLAMWADAVRAAGRYSWTGAGAGAFPYALRRSHPYLTAYSIDHPHNEYLETAVEWGIPAGALLVAGAGIFLARQFRRLESAAPERRAAALGALAGAGAILLHAAADFPLRMPAILWLLAALMGIAAGALDSSTGQRQAATRCGRAATFLFALALVTLSLWTAPVASSQPRGLDGWNAEAYYAAGRRALEEGRADQAVQAFRQALAANPYAAAVWSELAQTAEARGERGTALAAGALAEKLEPYNRQGQWEAANLRLRLGDRAGAMERFGALIGQAPEWRRAVWEVCWNARLEPGRILEKLAEGQGSLREYFQYLVDRGRWEALPEVFRRTRSRPGEAPEPEAIRETFDRLFRAEGSKPALRLWEVVSPLDKGFVNGSLERPPLGYGLDWAIRPVEGVWAERRSEGAGNLLAMEFVRPENIFYAGVTHDFAVTPGREYRLSLEARAEKITS